MSEGEDSSAGGSKGDYKHRHTQENYSSSVESGSVHGNPFVRKSYEWSQLKREESVTTDSIPGIGKIERSEHVEHLLGKKLTTVVKDLKDEVHYDVTFTESEVYFQECLVSPKNKNGEIGQYEQFLLDLAKRVSACRCRFILFEEVVQTLIDSGIDYDDDHPKNLAVSVIECAVKAGIFKKAYNFDEVTSDDAMWITN